MDNLEFYEKARSVPESAKKPIEAGRLKGMTDINPMWRIKKLTELYGPCGIGWYTEIVREWKEDGADGTVGVFIDVHLYIKVNGEWSKPIFGTGGSMFVTKEKNGLYTSDEAYKMAYTDALSVCCKALGFAADVYWQKDRTKYSPDEDQEHAKKIKQLWAVAKEVGKSEEEIHLFIKKGLKKESVTDLTIAELDFTIARLKGGAKNE